MNKIQIYLSFVLRKYFYVNIGFQWCLKVLIYHSVCQQRRSIDLLAKWQRQSWDVFVSRHLERVYFKLCKLFTYNILMGFHAPNETLMSTWEKWYSMDILHLWKQITNNCCYNLWIGCGLTLVNCVGVISIHIKII